MCIRDRKSGTVLSTSLPHTSQPGGVCLANSSTLGLSLIHICLPEIAAVSTRPAFSEHIALTLQGQAPIFLVIVGAPFCHQSADFLFFLACQFTGHGFTSRQRFSKAPGNRTHSRSPASRDSRSSGSPWALSGQPEPWAGGAASSFFHRGYL